MVSFLASTCWPTRFLAKWLATFFGAILLGVFWGWHNRPQPKPPSAKQAPALKNVQIHLRAVDARVVHPEGTEPLVPAVLWTGGVGDSAVQGSYLGPVSTDPKKLTPLSWLPGSRRWLIFRWKGEEYDMLIDPWPLTTNTWTAKFPVDHPNPHTGGHGAAH